MVTNINDAPDAKDDTATTAEDTKVTINVLANDTDADQDKLTVTGFTGTPNATVTLNPDGTITYDPIPNFNGVGLIHLHDFGRQPQRHSKGHRSQ